MLHTLYANLDNSIAALNECFFDCLRKATYTMRIARDTTFGHQTIDHDSFWLYTSVLILSIHQVMDSRQPDTLVYFPCIKES